MDISEDPLENSELQDVHKSVSETIKPTDMVLDVQENSQICQEKNLEAELEKYKNQLNNYNEKVDEQLIEKNSDNNVASSQDNNAFTSLLTQSSIFSTDESIINSQKYSAESGQIGTENTESDSEIYASENLMLSESEEEHASPIKRNRSKKIKKILDSDSEEEQDHGGKNEQEVEKIASGIDSESVVEASEDQKDENLETESTSKPHKSKYSSLIDTDSESDNEDHEEKLVEEDQLPIDSKIKKKKSKPPQRNSAKVAMDNMKAIKSETQRLARESYINIPYHKPKHHTFEEFMTRKTLGKVQSGIINAKNPKLMSKEDLVKYAKYLEERAKEATEFFKSESEDELIPTENNKENIDANVQKSQQDTEAVIVKEVGENPTAANIESMEATPSINEKAEQSKEDTIEPPVENEQDNILTPAFEEEPTSETPKLSDLKKQLIEENVLTNSPTLHGFPKMCIDLETGDIVSPKPTGVDNLLQRFMKNSAKRKSNSQSSVKILSTENGTIEMMTLNINLTSERNDVEQKPGSAYVKLKNDLKSIITKKRKAELMKRMQNEEDYYENEKEICCKEDEEEDDNEIGDDELCVNEEDEEIDEVDEEVDEEEVDDDKKVNELEEEVVEAEEDDEELDDDADDELGDDDDEDNKSENAEEPQNKPKRRIIQAFDDSDEEGEDTEHNKLEPLDVGNKSVLWVDEEEKQDSDEESELLGLCSGRFGPTQKSQIPTTVVMSQIPTTQFRDDMDENELLDMCSGKFIEPEKDLEETEVMTPADCLNLESSEDEDEVNQKKKQNNRKENRKRKLGFSDDEDDIVETLNQQSDIEDNKSDEPDANLDSDEEADNDPIEEDQPETFIDYDSEENEIEVQMTKKDCLKKVGDFFEQEAELSESEWGSADEDEKDMDKYDIELGDEDEFDKEKIRSELGQIHLRKLLDQDIRDVKKIQDMLFEDEENAGVGRERKFKWKNADNDFSLQTTGDDPTENENNDENIADEENEELWRKMRHDREVMLQEKKLEKTDEVSLIASLTSTESCLVSSATTKKITVIKSKTPNTSINNGQMDSPFLISKKTQKSSIRGSFLVRDKETLNRIAQLTKTGAEAEGNTTKGSGKNFVFATIDSEVIAETAMKRKSADSSKDCDLVNPRKKQKLNRNRRNEMIDHLT